MICDVVNIITKRIMDKTTIILPPVTTAKTLVTKGYPDIEFLQWHDSIKNKDCVGRIVSYDDDNVTLEYVENIGNLVVLPWSIISDKIPLAPLDNYWRKPYDGIKPPKVNLPPNASKRTKDAANKLANFAFQLTKASHES